MQKHFRASFYAVKDGWNLSVQKKLLLMLTKNVSPCTNKQPIVAGRLVGASQIVSTKRSFVTENFRQ